MTTTPALLFFVINNTKGCNMPGLLLELRKMVLRQWGTKAKTLM